MSSNNRTGNGLRASRREASPALSKANIRKTLADALAHKINLDGISLAGCDLRRINLDGITLSHADLSGCDLSGANLSEAKFENCNFSRSILFDTCFAYSDFKDCNFEETVFGQTDMSEARLQDCIFSGPSVFSLPLANSQTLQGSRYLLNRRFLSMAKPPIVVNGFKYPIFLLDNKIVIQGEIYDMDRAALFAKMDLLLSNIL